MAVVNHDGDYWYGKLSMEWQRKAQKLVDRARQATSTKIERKAQDAFYKTFSLKSGQEVRFGWRTPLSPVGLHITIHKPKTMVKSFDFEVDESAFVWMPEKHPHVSGFSDHTHVLGWMMLPVTLEDSRITCPYDNCHISVAIYAAEID